MKQKIYFITALILCTSITAFPSNNAILDAIYAADKAGELACFADNKYIHLLEQKNAELLAQKYNYKGLLTKTPYFTGAFFGSLGTMSLGTGAMLKAAELFIRSIALESATKGWIPLLFDRENMFKNQEESVKLKIMSFLSLCLGGFLFKEGISAMDYVQKCRKNIDHDRILDSLIAENQTIIEKLKEIKASKKIHNAPTLLAHLKEVKANLQDLIEYQQEGMQWFKELYLSDPKHHQDEIGGILLLNLCEDFYNNSEILQKKLSEFVTLMFDLICNDRAMVSDISVDMFQAYNESTFDTNTAAQLRASFESMYNKSEEIKSYCKNHPNSDLAQTPIDELFEDALDAIIYNDGMLTYEAKTLIKKIDAKIAELEL